MRLTKQSARNRALKGWETRRRRGRVRSFVKDRLKRSLHPKNVFNRNAEYALDNWVENRVNRWTWHRPNGEHIKLTGFNKADVGQMKVMMARMDARLRPEIKLGTRLEKKELPFLVRATSFGQTGAASIAQTDNKFFERRWKIAEKERGKAVGPFEKAADRAAIYAWGGRNYERIVMPPSVLDSPINRNKFLPEETSVTLRVPKTKYGLKTKIGGKEPKWAHFVPHELGHAIDKQGRYSRSPGFRDAAKWKRGANNWGTGVGGAVKVARGDSRKQKDYNGGWYQAVSPSEDFAETFAKGLYTSLSSSTAKYDKSRRAYMESAVFLKSPRKGIITKEEKRILTRPWKKRTVTKVNVDVRPDLHTKFLSPLTFAATNIEDKLFHRKRPSNGRL